MIKKYLSPAEINRLFQALKIGKHVEWPMIGYILLSVEHYQIWHADCNSFTAWVRTFAKEIKKQESSCWRYLSAAKFYLMLTEILNDHKIACPVITELPECVSPENVELLEKLHRVMPHDQFLNYANRTIKNNIKRKELREAWAIYRPSLQGRTARGIRVAPTVNTKDQYQFDSQAEAIAITSLINSDGNWTNKNASDFYKTFRGVKLPISVSGIDNIFEPDLCVLTGSKKTNEMNFHIVEYSSLMNHQASIEKLVSMSKKANYIWVLFQNSAIELTKVLPQYFGLIGLSGPDNFIVHREARYTEIDQTCLLKQLVLNSI
jgi:hypothetical protein